MLPAFAPANRQLRAWLLYHCSALGFNLSPVVPNSKTAIKRARSKCSYKENIGIKSVILFGQGSMAGIRFGIV